jgi:hypothetical protein
LPWLILGVWQILVSEIFRRNLGAWFLHPASIYLNSTTSSFSFASSYAFSSYVRALPAGVRVVVSKLSYPNFKAVFAVQADACGRADKRTPFSPTDELAAKLWFRCRPVNSESHTTIHEEGTAATVLKGNAGRRCGDTSRCEGTHVQEAF